MNFITRFAPSPTGFLHVGNLRTAILNYLVSKKSTGQFILRLDDTDKERSEKQFSDQIKRDLEWLGLEWDRCEKQSDRIPLYESAAQQLRDADFLYECFETPEELEFKRRKQLSMGRPPVYDRSALKLSVEEKNCLREKRPSYWRFKLNHERVVWQDAILGSVSVDASSVSDPVLIRADGQFLYTLASVVDDVDFGINFVIRGSDHVTNTATQIQLLQKFKSALPSFAHHSLLVGPSGEPLSKRMKNLSLRELKEMGLEPEAIFIFMSNLGGKNTLISESSVGEILENFDLNHFGAAPTKFNQNDLNLFSQKFLTKLPFDQVKKQLSDLNIPKHLQEEFWDMAKENISRRSDLSDLWRLCTDGVEPEISPQDRDFISTCMRLIPSAPRNRNSWSVWTNTIAVETSRSGKNLFLPLRKALTGKDSGPDMKKLFPLMQNLRLK